ncbi:MAG TPA: helix-turn-helix domain-containing protein [Thermohalobaculum sp.]|nr:helix-turn-helix domain-containing protein [Thermohalobaculum sp.]
MAGSAQQLTVDELEERFRGAKDVIERSHCQAIWLLAKGHSPAEVAQIVALTPRWVWRAPLGLDRLSDFRLTGAGLDPRQCKA